MLTDSRLKDFLKDARQAVVLAGGVNGQSMPRLMALAQKYGLSEDEQKEAMRLLQNSGKTESAKQKAFRASVEKYLKKKNVLTPCIRRQLIEVATNGKLSEDEANQVIDSVAQELDVPVFSQNDAVEHMTKQIEQMKENGLLTQERLADVYSEAEQWGVSKKEVNQIIRRTTENEPEGEPQKRKKFNPALLSGLIAATVVLLLAGGLAAYYFVNLSKEKEPGSTKQVAKGGTTNVVKPKPKPKPVPPKTSTWPDPVLARLLIKAEPMLAGEPGLKKLLESDKEVDHVRAYVRMLPPSMRLLRKTSDEDLLADLVAHLHAVDTDAQASMIQSELVKMVGSDVKAPSSTKSYRLAYWSMLVLTKAVKHPRVTEKRANEIQKHLASLFGKTVDVKQPLDTLYEELGTLLSSRLHRALEKDNALHAAGQSAFHFLVLHQQSRTYLPAEEQERLKRELLLTALPQVAPRDYISYLDLLNGVLDSTDVTGRFKVLSLYASTKNMALQSFLQPRLAARAAIAITPGMTPAQVEEQIKKKWAGVNPTPPTKGSRLETLLALSKRVLGNVGASPNRRTRILQETVDLMHASTLACALAKGDGGHATFDAVVKDISKLGASTPPPGAMAGGKPGMVPGAMVGMKPGMIPGAGAAGVAGVAGRVPGAGVAGVLGGRPGMVPGAGAAGVPPVPAIPGAGVAGVAGIRGMAPGGVIGRMPAPGGGVFGAPPDLGTLMKGLSSNKTATRVAHFATLTTTLATGVKLETQHAERLAVYLLTRRGKEWMSVKGMLARLQPTRELLLALADNILRASSAQVVEDIAGSLLRKDMDLLKNRNWRRDARKEILSSVLKTMSTGGNVADEASERFVTFYKQQGTMMGMRGEDFFLAKTPSQVLEALIKHRVSSLEKKGHASREALAEHLNQIDAGDLIAITDLRKTVLLQRIWARVLGLQVIAKNAALKDRVETLTKALDEENLKADHILTQLRAGEEKVHRLWMLLHEGE